MFGKDHRNGHIPAHAWLEASCRAGMANLEPEYKAMLQSYSDGVMPIRDHLAEALSLEYAVLNCSLPTTRSNPGPANIAMGQMSPGTCAATWMKRSSAILLKTRPEQIDRFPSYPTDHPVIVNNIGDGTSVAPTSAYAVVNIPDER
jgi:hypothetical protein